MHFEAQFIFECLLMLVVIGRSKLKLNVVLSGLFAEVTVEFAINLRSVQLYYGCLSTIHDLPQTVEE